MTWTLLAMAALITVVVVLGARRLLKGSGASAAKVELETEIAATGQELRRQASRFDHFADRVKNPLRKQLRHIAQMTRDMRDHMKRDPSKHALVKEFLDFHVSRALGIVEGYMTLREQKYLDDAARLRLEETEKTLDKIEAAFQAEHTRLLESDAEALEIDRRVYEELLRLDGDGYEDLRRLGEQQRTRE